MAENGNAKGSSSMDAKQQTFTAEQIEILKKRQAAYFVNNAGRLRRKNIITGLTIGGVVLAIYGYSFFSVSQEKFLDELEDEAKIVRANYSKTSAN